jgi:hypothetical protein
MYDVRQEVGFLEQPVFACGLQKQSDRNTPKCQKSKPQETDRQPYPRRVAYTDSHCVLL